MVRGNYGADRGIRTHDPLFTKQPLWPLSYVGARCTSAKVLYVNVQKYRQSVPKTLPDFNNYNLLDHNALGADNALWTPSGHDEFGDALGYDVGFGLHICRFVSFL